MLSLLGRSTRLCDGIDRREGLRIGGPGFTGPALPASFRPPARADALRPSAGTLGKAKSCILIFNYGGPSHLDIWDLKPDAPAEVRGEFKPVATNVPGLSITEHLPKLGKLADRYAV